MHIVLTLDDVLTLIVLGGLALAGITTFVAYQVANFVSRKKTKKE